MEHPRRGSLSLLRSAAPSVPWGSDSKLETAEQQSNSFTPCTAVPMDTQLMWETT